MPGEGIIRLAFFFGVLAVIAAWEVVAPRRALTDSKRRCWVANLPWWDRLGGTYRPQPEQGHTAMVIGLKEFRDPAKLDLGHLLVQPFILR